MYYYKVGNELLIDPINRKVTKDGQNITLTELSYRLLLELVKSAPDIIPHDQLIKAVWQERVVSDENLKKRISRLRETLSDDHTRPKYFMAERGMGYRCVATVEIVKCTDSKKKNLVCSQTNYSNWRFIAHKPTRLVFSFVALALCISLFVFICNGDKALADLTNEKLEYQAVQNYLKFTEINNGKAIDLYRALIKGGAIRASVHSGLSDAYLQGYWLYGKHNSWLKLGKEHAEIAIKINNNLAWGHKSLGLAYYLLGQYEKARASLAIARQIEPAWGEVSAYAALVDLQLGHFIDAQRHATASVELDSTNPLPNAILGEFFRKSYRFDAADKQYLKTLNINPHFLISHLLFSEYLLANGRQVEAIKCLRKVIQINSNSQQAYWLLGLALILENRIEEAIEQFTFASNLGGPFSLSAKVYLAGLKNDKTELAKLGEQIAILKQHDNKWAELTFLEGIVLLISGESIDAANKFESAIANGFTTQYRFTHLPISSEVELLSHFDELISLIENENQNKLPKRVPPRI
ncbi:winged helix-turn-helix domain-containing protein [Pseudoalteromonas distincta]|uniref:winged helix-turn-helix domain-containing protein n=1 Tax=Pseudoalteromonas distincta TaxID=77608 RepID=UPI0032E0DE00